MLNITVIIPVFNSEYYLNNLLLSVVNQFKEVIVIDSYSDDTTPQIVKKFEKVRFFQRAYDTSAKQKNWAIEKATSDWVLIIDSDEVLEDGFITHLNDELRLVSNDVGVIFLPRRNLFWGKDLGKASGYPDYQSRLFRSHLRYEDKEVHAQIVNPNNSIYLKKGLIHDDFKKIDTLLLRNIRYYNYELSEHLKKETKWSFTLQYVKPTYVFVKFYFLKGGFRKGFRGFFFAFQWLVYFFIVAAKLYENERIKINEKH